MENPNDNYNIFMILGKMMIATSHLVHMKRNQ